MDPLAVKGWLQRVFEVWGKPQRIRVDNGKPWGTNSRVPSALALWLVGLDIDVVYGRPARSTDNAIIERTHGVLAQWIDPDHQAHLEALQDRLEWAVHTQRERYRSPHHLTRAESYPQLYTNGRLYRCQWDEAYWDMTRVAHYLSRYTFERKVEKNGRITLFTHTYSVGRAYARQIISITLDVHSLEWVFIDQQAVEIQRHSSRELDYTIISNLQLGKHQ